MAEEDAFIPYEEFERNSSLDAIRAMLARNASSPCNASEMAGNATNCSRGLPSLPATMIFGDDHILSVICYSILFVIAACGNLTVFITLFRNRHIKSRVNMFIMHLSVADLIVTFIMMPLEIVWHITVAWKAGDVACRILMFFRAFGFYLSSFILVAISLDRYSAIMHPLSLNDADRRGKIMLILAWTLSFVASAPQSVIFHVEAHPDFPWFTQCVTFNFFPSEMHELAYNLFNIIAVYLLPLIIISASYCLILYEITRKTRQSKDELTQTSPGSKIALRRSAVGNIKRARIRTLKMTFVIVGVFVMCWTPYFVISTWWWFDKASASQINPKVQRGLFIFAVSNSCMDPIVYGMFTLKFRKEFERCCCFKSRWSRKKSRESMIAHRRRSESASMRRSTSSTASRATERLTLKSVDSNMVVNRYMVTSIGATTSTSRTSLCSVSRENCSARANINNFVGIGSLT